MLWFLPVDGYARGKSGLVLGAHQDPLAEEEGRLLRMRTWRIGAAELNGRLDEASILSSALGVTKIRFRAFKRTQQREVMQCAQRLGAEREVARHLQGMGLRDGDTVVALGDERTSDRQSWFEVLSTLYFSLPVGPKVRFVNLASPGQTTCQMLDTMETIRGLRPRLVLCMPGIHDARRAGRRHAPMAISLRETDRNLFEMRSAIRSGRWLWIVPPAHRANDRFYQALLPQRQYRWIDADCNAIRSLVRSQDEHVVDPFEPASQTEGANSEREPIDPLLYGRCTIVRSVLQGLTS